MFSRGICLALLTLALSSLGAQGLPAAYKPQASSCETQVVSTVVRTVTVTAEASKATLNLNNGSNGGEAIHLDTPPATETAKSSSVKNNSGKATETAKTTSVKDNSGKYDTAVKAQNTKDLYAGKATVTAKNTSVKVTSTGKATATAKNTSVKVTSTGKATATAKSTSVKITSTGKATATAKSTSVKATSSAVNNGGKGGAAGSSATASAGGAAASAAPAKGGAANNTNAQTSLTLDPRVIATGFENDGQDVPAAGQVPSITSSNNFINFCLTVPNLPITNGKQITTGSCNPAPIGAIPSVDNMPSSKFTSPPNFGTIKADTPFTIEMAIQNMQTGFFVNAQANYFAAPQVLNAQGQIQGHSHVVIEELASLGQTNPTDPKKFAFFKGLNGAAVGGKLTADVAAGLPAGFYKLSSINAAANHQPVIVPVAQHGSLDDAIYFSVTKDGKPIAGALGSAPPAAAAVSSKAASAAASATAKAASASASASSKASTPVKAASVSASAPAKATSKAAVASASAKASAPAKASASVSAKPAVASPAKEDKPAKSDKEAPAAASSAAGKA